MATHVVTTRLVKCLGQCRCCRILLCEVADIFVKELRLWNSGPKAAIQLLLVGFLDYDMFTRTHFRQVLAWPTWTSRDNLSYVEFPLRMLTPLVVRPLRSWSTYSPRWQDLFLRYACSRKTYYPELQQLKLLCPISASFHLIGGQKTLLRSVVPFYTVNL